MRDDNARHDGPACVAVDRAMLQQMRPAHGQSLIDQAPLARLGVLDAMAAIAAWIGGDARSIDSGAVFALRGGHATG